MNQGKFGNHTWKPLLLLAVAFAGSVIVAYRLGRQEAAPDVALAAEAAVAGEVGPAPDPAIGRASTGSMKGAPAAPEPEPMSPVLFAQVMRERAAELDRNFLEDPVSPGWASAMEADIEAVISKSGYLGEPEYGIAGHRVECRSKGCEVSLDFPKEGLAEEATALLRMAVSSHFSQALTVPLRNPDGSVQYRIYLVTSDAGNLLRKRAPAASGSADTAG